MILRFNVERPVLKMKFLTFIVFFKKNTKNNSVALCLLRTKYLQYILMKLRYFKHIAQNVQLILLSITMHYQQTCYTLVFLVENELF